MALRVSAVNHDKTRSSPVVPWPFFWLLMALNFFTKLPLPAGVHVPAAAINPLAVESSPDALATHCAAQGPACFEFQEGRVGR